MTKRKDRAASLLPSLFLASALIAGCGGDSGDKPPTDPGPGDEIPTYTTDIKPIITPGCSCHQEGGIKYSTVPLDTYARVYAKRDRVKQRTGVEGSMPPAGALPSDQRQTIIAWVDGGAPE